MTDPQKDAPQGGDPQKPWWQSPQRLVIWGVVTAIALYSIISGVVGMIIKSR
ncbi:hypothetical protein [Galbitalea soli]|uniref:Uncharacterized protein n=1 Tax=Galbitalea soli TaxID=1268042 RepID=A0A7C9TSU9_9MICO|nr:hypothetical protein [Galbitalea soli]NEM92002.1 hypothetical protein [Galbitalea soli]NYJ32048.1 hypothetical protein [Galbitalea soli]